jgi:hypothetical protein
MFPYARLLAGLAFAFVLPFTALDAQTAEDFDESRAYIGERPMFDAFYPDEYEPLADLRRSGRVNDDTALLVLRRGETTLTLLTMQMSYHHIAQGDLAGEPWMVSF